MSQESIELLVAKYYQDAYKLAADMNFRWIPDDVRENIAFAALERAAKSFDPTRGVKFTTYLYRIIRNALTIEHNRRQPYRMVDGKPASKKNVERGAQIDIGINDGVVEEFDRVCVPKRFTLFSNLSNSRSCIFVKDDPAGDFVAIFSDNEHELFDNEFSFKQFLTQLRECLTDKQQKILEMVLYPEIYKLEYEAQFKEELPTQKLPMFAIGRLLGCSKQAVDQQLHRIALKAKRLYKEVNKL